VAAGETRTYAKHVHSYLQVAFKQLPEVALDLVAGQGSDQISTIVANDLGSVPIANPPTTKQPAATTILTS
jgi:hypothetical protein